MSRVWIIVVALALFTTVGILAQNGTLSLIDNYADADKERCRDCISYYEEVFMDGVEVESEFKQQDVFYINSDGAPGLDCSYSFRGYQQFTVGNTYNPYTSQEISCSEIDGRCVQIEINSIKGNGEGVYGEFLDWSFNTPIQHPSCQEELQETVDLISEEINITASTIMYVCPDGASTFSLNECSGGEARTYGELSDQSTFARFWDWVKSIFNR